MLTVAVRRCCAGVAARAAASAVPSRMPALAARRPGPGSETGTPRGNCRTFAATGPEALGMQKVLFVEVGMGADQHGQDATKAAVRACRNAIEFNSIPSIRDIVPGGYDNMKLHIQLGVPEGSDVDLGKVRAVFPYGNIVNPVDVCVGGLMAKSGIAIPEMGDKNDDFVIAVASITVGY